MVFYSQLDGSVLQVCGEWFQSVRSSNPSDALLCLLLLTATLERALGDVCPMLNVHSQRVYYSYTVFWWIGLPLSVRRYTFHYVCSANRIVFTSCWCVAIASHCPTLLKDLLSTEELEQTFGRPAVGILSIMFVCIVTVYRSVVLCRYGAWRRSLDHPLDSTWGILLGMAFCQQQI